MAQLVLVLVLVPWGAGATGRRLILQLTIASGRFTRTVDHAAIWV
jgi:hypothetical protein